MHTILETPRLALRELTLGDLDFIAEVMAHPEVMQFWPNWQWSKGSYTCLKPGQYTRFNGLLSQPQMSGRLLFAGEHASADDSGFMNGAVQSGNGAAHAVVASRKPRAQSYQQQRAFAV